MSKGCPIPLSVAGLTARAKEISGVDIADDNVMEPLTIPHRSRCEESQRHEKGAIAQLNKLLRLLANRHDGLRILDLHLRAGCQAFPPRDASPA